MPCRCTLSHSLRRRNGLKSKYLLGSSLVMMGVVSCMPGLVQAQSVGSQLKNAMGEERFRDAGLNKLSEEELLHLSLFILENSNKGVQPPPPVGVGGDNQQPTEMLSFEDLEGGSIVAQDGTFLGRIDRSRIDERSLSNRVGDYGSRISSESILNGIGRYGSKISPESPFNRFATEPPRLFDKNRKFAGYLTTNKLIRPRIDPTSLLEWLELR